MTWEVVNHRDNFTFALRVHVKALLLSLRFIMSQMGTGHIEAPRCYSVILNIKPIKPLLDQVRDWTIGVLGFDSRQG